MGTRLCVGTLKGIVILDADRCGAPLAVLADPCSVWCMAQDCHDPNLIYCGSTGHTHMGIGNQRGATLARSADGGRTWSDVTPRGAHDEEVWALATPPDSPGHVFAGTSHARLFHSENEGRSFDECSAFLKVRGRDRWSFPRPPHVPHIRSISFDPSHPAVMYIGVEEGGVIRSRDRGETFEVLGRGIYSDVHTIAVDPDSSRRLYATTGRGFYLSEDGGASWRQVQQGITRPYTVPLVAAASSDAIYTAGAAGPPPLWSVKGADALMFRSLDHGRSFHPIAAAEGPSRGMVMRMVLNRAKPDELFAVANDGAVMKISDRGQVVSVIATNLPPAYDLVLMQ